MRGRAFDLRKSWSTAKGDSTVASELPQSLAGVVMPPVLPRTGQGDATPGRMLRASGEMVKAGGQRLETCGGRE